MILLDKFVTGNLSRKTLLLLSSTIFVLYSGTLALAIRLFPGPYDWRRKSIAKLLYPENNPRFHFIASFGIVVQGCSSSRSLAISVGAFGTFRQLRLISAPARLRSAPFVSSLPVSLSRILPTGALLFHTPTRCWRAFRPSPSLEASWRSMIVHLEQISTTTTEGHC